MPPDTLFSGDTLVSYFTKKIATTKRSSLPPPLSPLPLSPPPLSPPPLSPPSPSRTHIPFILPPLPHHSDKEFLLLSEANFSLFQASLPPSSLPVIPTSKKGPERSFCPTNQITLPSSSEFASGSALALGQSLKPLPRRPSLSQRSQLGCSRNTDLLAVFSAENTRPLYSHAATAFHRDSARTCLLRGTQEMLGIPLSLPFGHTSNMVIIL